MTRPARLLIAAAAAALALAAAPAASAATPPIASTFNANDEGWLVTGDSLGGARPSWQPSGGNPGGFIRISDAAGGVTMFWLAPAKFLGARSTSYGQTLSFDLRQSSLSNQFNFHDVMLTGAGMVLTLDHSPNPGLTWTRYTVPLSEAAPWMLQGAGRLATRAEIRAVLGSLTKLQIRAEFMSGPDTDDLDNVVMGVDGEPPDTTITSGPAGLVNARSHEFAFESSEERSTFECSLDGAAFAPCSSPHAVGPLDDGAHVFEVRAIDEAGNPDPAPARAELTVDATPPDTTIDAGPEGESHAASPEFEFSASEQGSSFECSLDGAAFEPCSSPRSVGPLEDGEHVFEVRATDAAGNVDPTPARRTWTVRLCKLVEQRVEAIGLDICI